MLEKPSGVRETQWGVERAGTCPELVVVSVLSVLILCAGAEGGHDCAEDATCCMQLMLRRAHSDHLQSLRSKRGSVTMTAASARPSEVDT